MVQHGAIWAALSAEKKDKFESMAKAMRDHTGGELQEYIVEQTDAFFQNLMSSDMWSKKQLEANRQRSCSCPQSLSVHTFAGEYVSRSSLEVPEQPHLSPLGRRIACARDVLQGVALGVPDGESVIWYKFTHALLAPGRLFLLPLE
eukprot:1408643-Amphidinium_carterae.1